MILTDPLVIEDRKGAGESADTSNATFHLLLLPTPPSLWRVSVRLRLVIMIALFHGGMTDISHWQFYTKLS